MTTDVVADDFQVLVDFEALAVRLGVLRALVQSLSTELWDAFLEVRV